MKEEFNLSKQQRDAEITAFNIKAEGIQSKPKRVIVQFWPEDNCHLSLAVDNFGSVWQLINAGQDGTRWEKLPDLPRD